MAEADAEGPRAVQFSNTSLGGVRVHVAGKLHLLPHLVTTTMSRRCMCSGKLSLRGHLVLALACGLQCSPVSSSGGL